ncbi:hypothetical protein O6H91_06G047100 [Diphasiastrum complanatum]|nr:hypothetical protein O6H91_06G047100 [Diphasiastrum complanatum]
MRVRLAWRTGQLLSAPRVRQIQKSLYNLKLTLLCGFITFLVLRGTFGAGNFGTPAQDFYEIRELLPHRKEPSRILTQLREPKKQEADPSDKNMDTSSTSSYNYSLGPKITDWDKQRKQWLARHFLSRAGKPKILLVTGSQPTPCDNPVGDHQLLKAMKNKIDYCRLHGMEIFYNTAHLDQEMAGYWAKLPLLRRLMLAHPEADWLWWMDSDALFTDMVFELPMERYESFELVLHGWEEMVYDKQSWVGLNTGSFLLRNSQWGLDLLDAWAPMGPKGVIRTEVGKMLTNSLKGRPEFEADDQSALIHLLITQSSVWKDKVYLEHSFYLHGYWAILVEKYEKMMEQYHPGYGDDRWPFITHFVGCKPCGGSGDWERCLKHMERAFNFADNQVLEIYGFRHLSLSTHEVKKIRNDTSNPLEDLPNLKTTVPIFSLSTVEAP